MYMLNIRKMSPTLVVLVLSSLKPAFGRNPKTGCPNLVLISLHIFSGYDAKIPSMADNDFCVASLQTYSRNYIRYKSPQRATPSLFLSAVKVIERKRNLIVSALLLTLPGIFNLTEQALKTLSAS